MLSFILTSLLAAVIPTVIFVYLIWWCDRYEREPGWLLLTTFLWGAIPAIILSVAAELLLQVPFKPFDLGLFGSLIETAGISPLVEEIFKGAALFGLWRFLRSEIDGVLDGIVYGALVGAGFGMTENFFYFLDAAFESGLTGLAGITVLRALVFGANHAFFTAILGATVGYAVNKDRERTPVGWPLLGLSLAIGVHMLHNVGATLAVVQPFALLFSVMLSWGGVLLLAAVIVLAWRQEKRWIRAHLADEVPDLLSAEMYEFTQTYAQRGGVWLARLRREDSARVRFEAELHRTATELAFHKHRLAQASAHSDPDLEQKIEALRQRLREQTTTPQA